MKNRIQTLAIIGFLSVASLLIACKSSPEKKEKTTEDVKVVQYTCPMHPEVVTNSPGTCPKCGMELVLKKE
jgi:Cu(I)/Ag(I) efflux system membrane fusion protein